MNKEELHILIYDTINKYTSRQRKKGIPLPDIQVDVIAFITCLLATFIHLVGKRPEDKQYFIEEFLKTIPQVEERLKNKPKIDSFLEAILQGEGYLKTKKRQENS